MNRVFIGLFLFLSMGIAACESAKPNKTAKTVGCIENTETKSAAQTNDSIDPRFTLYNGKTISTYGRAHGTQIEYLGEGGKGCLWYPGNKVVVPARWMIAGGEDPNAICFMYPKKSHNPVSKLWGGTYSCLSLRNFKKTLTGVRSGDVFNLSSGKIPWVLERESTMTELLKKMNK